MNDIARGLLLATLCSLVVFSLLFALVSHAIGGSDAGGEIMLGLILAAVFGFGAFTCVRAPCAPEETGAKATPAVSAEPSLATEAASHDAALQADPCRRGRRVTLTAIALMIAQRAAFWVFDPSGSAFASALSQVVFVSGIVMATVMLVSRARMEMNEQRRA